ncbi:MAG: FxDxF family PEP-CTERM protein, partial [Janthinobacterium sp.]
TPFDNYSGAVIDNVSVMAAVPEPETYAMLLAGLGLMGFLRRRKAAK